MNAPGRIHIHTESDSSFLLQEMLQLCQTLIISASVSHATCTCQQISSKIISKHVLLTSLFLVIIRFLLLLG